LGGWAGGKRPTHVSIEKTDVKSMMMMMTGTGKKLIHAEINEVKTIVSGCNFGKY